MKTCAHCGLTCGNYEGGYASLNFAPLCHPNAAGRPDCYRRVTVYGEPLGALRDVTPKPDGIDWLVAA